MHRDNTNQTQPPNPTRGAKPDWIKKCVKILKHIANVTKKKKTL